MNTDLTLNDLSADITLLILRRVFRQPTPDRANRLHCVIASLLHTAVVHAEAERKERQALGRPPVTIKTCYASTDTLLFEVCLQFGLPPTMLRLYRSAICHIVAKAYRVAEVITGSQYLVLSDALIDMNLIATDPRGINAEWEHIGKRIDLIGK